METGVSLKYFMNGCSSGVNANSRSKDGGDVAIKKYRDHQIKMINENISLDSRFSFNEIRECYIKSEFLI